MIEHTVWLPPVETKAAPLTMDINISLHRAPRQRCTNCGNRRVLYYVGLGDVIRSPLLCARCAGIR